MEAAIYTSAILNPIIGQNQLIWVKKLIQRLTNLRLVLVRMGPVFFLPAIEKAPWVDLIFGTANAKKTGPGLWQKI